LIGTCTVPGTGGWQNWVDVKCDVSGVSGIHDLYLKFTGGSGYLLNINWWKFGKTAVIPTPTPTPISNVRLGDVNEDGDIDSLDLQYLKRYVLRKIELTETGRKNADVNRDGSIDSLDVNVLKRYILRVIDFFPEQ